MGKKQENPDWYPSGRGRVPAGDPKNELGSVWIHIHNEQHPTGYGIHGTNHAETIGSACSEGCVRLVNEDASEVYWWVRTGEQRREGDARPPALTQFRGLRPLRTALERDAPRRIASKCLRDPAPRFVCVVPLRTRTHGALARCFPCWLGCPAVCAVQRRWPDAPKRPPACVSSPFRARSR